MNEDMKLMPSLRWRNGNYNDLNLYGEQIGPEKPVIVKAKDFRELGSYSPAIPGTPPRDRLDDFVAGCPPEVYGPYLFHPVKKQWFCRLYHCGSNYEVFSKRLWVPNDGHVQYAINIQNVTLPAAVEMLAESRRELYQRKEKAQHDKNSSRSQLTRGCVRDRGLSVQLQAALQNASVD